MKNFQKNNFRLINIIGIDGAGKTTLARSLTKELSKTDTSVQYCYSQYFAKLLYPVKQLAKLFFMGKTDEFKNYAVYNQTKKQTSSKYPFFASVYAFIWILDYSIQVFFKITLKVFSGRRLVIDRYIFDIAVNLSLTSNKDIGYAQKLIHRFLKFSIAPDRVIFIDLPEEIAFKRKDDIQDIEYLKERRGRYLILAEEFGFTVLDGTKSKKEILEQAMAVLAEPKNGYKKKLKNILYVHANNLDIGGADYCLFKLASQLNKKKFHPVVCLGKNTKILDLYKKEGIKTHVIDMERIKKSYNPFYLGRLAFKFFFTIKELRKIIQKEKIDLVHGNDLLDIYGPVAAGLEKKPSTQYIRWILESPLWLKKMLTYMVFRLNDRVMTVSHGVAEIMFSSKGKILPGVVTCYDWIDMEKVGHHKKNSDIRAEYRIPQKSPLIGCVGRLEAWKGQDVFIRSAAKVLEQVPGAWFLVVGGSVAGRGRESFSRQCRDLAEKLGISHRIIFTGHRPDMTNIMKSLDVFVHSSVTPDPLPGVIMEAMACRIPVVGANAGGVPEEINNQTTGFLYKPGDPDEMADKTIWLLEHPRNACQMGEAGYGRIMTLFEKTRLCKKIEKIYQNMIANHKNPRPTALICVPENLQQKKLAKKGDYHVQDL